MENQHYGYLLLLAANFIPPFAISIVHRRVLARLGLKLLHPTVLVSAIPFLIMDLAAVRYGWWQFNDDYVTGYRIIGLPIEEYLFFMLIPQACLLIWVVMKKYRTWAEVWADIKRHFHKS